MTITLGFSPCPNDTFIFDAWVHGRIDVEGLRVAPRLEDVETLNRLALEGALDVTKASYGVIPDVLDRYALLRAGGALGRGCGPLLVGREDRIEVERARVAIPGRRTTAHLLLRLRHPGPLDVVELPYDEIMPSVAHGEADLGLIIHESRFTYPDHGLRRVVDLGEWWEGETGSPIPLGGILARRTLGDHQILRVERVLRRSVEHAFAHPDASATYVRRHAREMDPEVVRRHIDLYVNDFTVELGEEGERAVAELFHRAEAAAPSS